MSLDHAILGFLAVEPLSGYDLKTRCFDGASSHAWTADQAQIYRTLDRLEQRAHVSSRTRRQTSRPDRRVYSITRPGLEALCEWLATPHPLAVHRDAFLVQLMHAAHISDEALLAVLATNRTSHQERLDSLRLRISDSDSDSPLPPRAAVLRRMSLDGAVAHERAAIDWLDDCIEQIAEGVSDAPSSGESFQRQLFVTAD